MDSIFPKDYFIPLDGQEFLLGRVIVNLYEEKFSSEIDIVFKEGLKIYKHVSILYDLIDEQDALDQGVQTLSSFLKS